jgi:acetyl-CoA carboxylase beta subunit
MNYSNAPLDVRLNALLDPGTGVDLEMAGHPTALRTARGLAGGKTVWLAASDASRARGAIGVAEAEQFCKLFRNARQAPAPIFLLLDSAGANVDEGLAALGGFRRLYREALLTRLAGVPMFALLGRACFGGSSMLAMLCHRRIYSDRTLLAATGPAIIQALAGIDQLDAADAAAVKALMGGKARAHLGENDMLIADELESFAACARTLATADVPLTLDIHKQHDRLGKRLGSEAQSVESSDTVSAQRMLQLSPPGYHCTARGDVLRASAVQPLTKPVLIGVLSGGSIGAAAHWTLADELLRVHASHPGTPVILVLDASGHAATRRDEELLLSEYIVHFALTAAWIASRGHRVVLWIPGHAAGAVYVAFAAPAEHVSASPSAQLRILPQAAVTQILRNPKSELSDADAWVRTGVTDGLLDSRLSSYGLTQ